ncbi:E3 ubiquitin-protein ligase ubr3-like [Babylonia areolata]|uniref:E3 ubiquitin-protein ligase ubr3-like n=1 Tax=Babylonia areolata TaxID=304850 RepID=UPI003FD404B1
MASKESHTTLMKRDQRQSMVAYVRQECLKHPNPKCLNDMLDIHLDPSKSIDDYESIQLLKWLMAGGPEFDLFAKKVREYDSSVMCGLVWTTNFVAYRCRTCAISPCMSLCSDCFMAGNHEGHDYNMFRSQAGGACDCGDSNVMNPAGFCSRHGPDNQQSASSPPAELLAVSQAMMPRIFMRLLFYLRDTSDPDSTSYSMNLAEAEQYIAFLQSLSDMGAAMRRIMTLALVDTGQYQALQKGEGMYHEKSILNFRGAFTRLEESDTDFSSDSEFHALPGFHSYDQYSSMLEELVFWLCKCEYPQTMVTLLLGLLPDDIYKNEFTVAFVRHYSKSVLVLTEASDRSTVANRVVHISVQLFSNESLATRMVQENRLLHTVVQSLKAMLAPILVPSTIQGGPLNQHKTVECEKPIMKEHCYWPVVSDLINLLSHRSVSHTFLQDHALRDFWLALLTHLQGMNLNMREMIHHVEYEPDTYYAAFSAELEISASPMWSLINHCAAAESKSYVTDMIKATLNALDIWFLAIDFSPGSTPHNSQLTFHLPLHRYLAAFLMLGVQSHGVSLESILPSVDKLCEIVMHPLQIQVCMPQIYGGMWVRNGIQIKGQAMTYVQCHFCYSMSDLDIYLLQVCAAAMQPDVFLEVVLDRFQIKKWLLFKQDHKAAEAETGDSTDFIMLDGCLSFLCALIGLRTYMGVGEEELVRIEMASLLCMNDRQHSQLSELMPERSGMSGMSKELFEPTLRKLADYKAPSFEAGSGLNQGCYTPKGSVWAEDFDPVMVAQRAIYKKDFQAAMDRYTAHVRSTGAFKGKNTPWPPYKIPGKIHVAYSKLYGILNCSTMHAFLYTVLFKTLHELPTMPDSVLYKTVHLLNLCLHFAPKTFPNVTPSVSELVKDGDLRNWFRTTDVKANACEVIHKVEWSPSDSGTGDMDHMDLARSSLEEVFNIHPSIVSSPSGPITAAQTGQFPSVSLPSGSVTSFTAVASSPQPVTATPDPVKPKYQSRGVTAHPSAGSAEKELGESIISLLVKLHDKMSSPPSLYKPGATRPTASTSSSSSREAVGDGTFYIARFLDQLSSSSTTAAKYVQSTCKAVHRKVVEEKGEDPEESDIKRKKAYDRQQRLMAKFASKQMAFMAQAQQGEEQAAEEDMTDSQEMEGATAQGTSQKYDCVICNQCTPSKPSKLMGLVVFMQSSSVLGHRQRTEVQESILSPPTLEQVADTRCGGVKRQRRVEMAKHFEETSCDLSISIGWDGGVYTSTCGHYLHLDCHKSYIDTLKRNNSHLEHISISRGEFYCPMCRQISNAMLPIVPEDEEDRSGVVRPLTSDPTAMVRDIAVRMAQKPKQLEMTELGQAVNKTLESLTYITKKTFPVLPGDDAVINKFLFITSVARTNLELELLFRGGTLEQPLSPSVSKKLCLSPLLSVLRLSIGDSPAPQVYARQWSHLTGVPLGDQSTSLLTYKQHVPLLMRDMVAQLCQLVLLLPLPVELDHFLCVVHKIYCVTFIQALTVLSCRLTQDERQAWCKKGSEVPGDSLQRWLNFIISELGSSPLYKETDGSNDFLAICQSVWSPLSVEAWVEDFCLPFLRVAALLRQHMFGPCLEESLEEQSEFQALVQYLGMQPLEASGGAESEVTGIACLRWAVSDPFVLVQAWCRDLSNFAKAKPAKCKALINIDDKWARPHLLALPERYYDIFTRYRHQACNGCRRVPKDPTLCLICGAFLCFREQCCADVSSSVYECVSHSEQCGGGTGIFLLVNSSIVVVLRGPRATLWGSVYLDQHGEEDRDLKRGKPLFLSRERLQFLESQWISHNFEQTCKRWIWHRDRL